MKYILKLLVLSALLTLNAYAIEEQHHKEQADNFYVATKALLTLGQTVEEESASLEGKTGVGFGLDLGYRVGNGFAVEIDATYASNTVTEVLSNGEKEEFNGEYITSSLDIMYGYEVMHKLEVFAKLGYEYELETISGLDIDTVNDGMIYAAGTEYEVSESMAVLAEYEKITIDGPRGDSIFVGLVYNF